MPKGSLFPLLAVNVERIWAIAPDVLQPLLWVRTRQGAQGEQPRHEAEIGLRFSSMSWLTWRSVVKWCRAWGVAGVKGATVGQLDTGDHVAEGHEPAAWSRGVAHRSKNWDGHPQIFPARLTLRKSRLDSKCNFMCSFAWDLPVLAIETLHPNELLGVRGHQNQTPRQRLTRDQGVNRPDGASDCFKVRPNHTCRTGVRGIKGHDFERDAIEQFEVPIRVSTLEGTVVQLVGHWLPATRNLKM